jgi:hypothetical protein
MNFPDFSISLKWLTLAAIAAAFAVYGTTDFSIGGATPLGLLLAAAAGWVLHHKVSLVSNLLLFFSGCSLIAFPFLFEAPFIYTFLAFPLAIYGLAGLISWWGKEGN